MPGGVTFALWPASRGISPLVMFEIRKANLADDGPWAQDTPASRPTFIRGRTDGYRFRDSKRSAGNARTRAGLGARRRRAGREAPARRRGLQEGIGRVAQESARPRALVSIHSERPRRHGFGAARERAGADGARRELLRRVVDEYAGTGRCNDDDVARARNASPEREVPEAAAERRKAHLLLDDREGR